MANEGERRNLPIPVDRGAIVRPAEREIERIHWLSDEIRDYRTVADNERIARRVAASQQKATAEKQAEQASSAADLSTKIGVGGGAAMTAALGAILATTTAVTISMVAATAVGVLVLGTGAWATYRLNRHAAACRAEAKEWGILVREFEKVDEGKARQENDGP